MQVNPQTIDPNDFGESVWDYPRPPRVEDVRKPVTVVFNGATIATTTRAKRVLETSHPPTYYIPREDVRMEHLTAVAGASSFSEWKGVAQYYDLSVGDRHVSLVAWSYRQPNPGFSAIRGHMAFYAEPMDGCYVGDERVRPQPGGFYGGWITDDIVGLV